MKNSQLNFNVENRMENFDPPLPFVAHVLMKFGMKLDQIQSDNTPEIQFRYTKWP